MNKKIFMALSAVLLLAIALSLFSCTAGKDDGDGKTNILCVLFPQYDWVKNIVGGSENVTVSLLIKDGTDPHSYQPSAADIKAIADCDIIVCSGGNADTWVTETLLRSGKKDTVRVALTELSGMTLHEVSSSSHGHSHEESGECSHEDHEHGSMDEHIWLSLKNASVAVAAITDEICKSDPENEKVYKENARVYTEKLNALDGDISAFMAQIPEENRFVLFADRFPFIYLLSDYGIGYEAAFEGCSTDANADFDTVIDLAEVVNQRGLKYVAITETSDGALAQTVIGNSSKKSAEVTVLNSLQRVTAANIEGGMTYLGVMTENIRILKQMVE